jgi:hypothetical protein
MRIVLLYVFGGVLVVVPLGAAATLAISPAWFRSVPLVLWAIWLIFSVWCALDGPTRVDSLVPPNRLHRLPVYEKRAMFLAIVNVFCGIATLIYVAWWS